jgi:hypothetical protein
VSAHDTEAVLVLEGNRDENNTKKETVRVGMSVSVEVSPFSSSSAAYLPVALVDASARSNGCGNSYVLKLFRLTEAQ